MELLADRIAGYFIRNGVADENNRDIYVYGLIHTFSHSICFLAAIAVGFTFSIPIEMLLFSITLSSLRISAGGYHAGSFWVCIAESVLTIIAIAVIIKVSPEAVYFPVTVILMVITVFAVFRFAPVEDKNRPLTSDEIAKFKKRSRLLVVGGSLVLGIIIAFGGNYYSFCAVLGFGVASASIPVALIKRKREVRRAYENE